MLIVAQHRALGKRWAEAAEKASLSPATAKNYPSRYPGWDDLVDHYRHQAFHQGVEEHFHAGSVEALDALRQEFREAASRLRQMESRAAEGELDPDEANVAIHLSRAVAYAADKYLKAIGFHRYRDRLAEMEAEEEKTGKVGKTVRVEGPSDLLDELDDMTAEEKTAAFKDLIGEGNGDGP